MQPLKPDQISPTDVEEADIQAEIAEDPEDSAHWEDSSVPRSAAEVAPYIVEGYRSMRGRQQSATKVSRDCRFPHSSILPVMNALPSREAAEAASSCFGSFGCARWIERPMRPISQPTPTAPGP